MTLVFLLLSRTEESIRYNAINYSYTIIWTNALHLAPAGTITLLITQNHKTTIPCLTTIYTARFCYRPSHFLIEKYFLKFLIGNNYLHKKKIIKERLKTWSTAELHFQIMAMLMCTWSSMFTSKSNKNQYIGVHIEIKILNVSVSLLFCFLNINDLSAHFSKQAGENGNRISKFVP